LFAPGFRDRGATGPQKNRQQQRQETTDDIRPFSHGEIEAQNPWADKLMFARRIITGRGTAIPSPPSFGGEGQCEGEFVGSEWSPNPDSRTLTPYSLPSEGEGVLSGPHGSAVTTSACWHVGATYELNLAMAGNSGENY